MFSLKDILEVVSRLCQLLLTPITIATDNSLSYVLLTIFNDESNFNIENKQENSFKSDYYKYLEMQWSILTFHKVGCWVTYLTAPI
jgi:hypothetical protein